MKWKVQAEMITDLYIIVEAEDEDQAYDMARDADGADFIEEGYGDWNLGSVIPMEESEDEV